jgi:hypothetical protein
MITIYLYRIRYFWMVVCMLGQFSNLVSLSRRSQDSCCTWPGSRFGCICCILTGRVAYRIRLVGPGLGWHADSSVGCHNRTGPFTGYTDLVTSVAFSRAACCLSLRTTAPIFILRTLGRAFIDLALFYLDFRRTMRPGSISQSLCADQIGLQYMITNYPKIEINCMVITTGQLSLLFWTATCQ